MSQDPILLIFVVGVLFGVGLTILAFLTPDFLHRAQYHGTPAGSDENRAWK